MSVLQDDLAAALRSAAGRLRGTGLPEELAAQLERLAEQVFQPCVVAVVGRVKAGKSTFINALLGEDLAGVGTTETTATINYFCYGRPNPERPVRCHWRSGQVTEESLAFVNGLQGTDLETLRRADGLHHLEYRLLNPYLQRVTLVDTPGTGAVVGEHQDRTAEFLHLHGQLRNRHEQETLRIDREADAVIYLIGATAGVADRDFLEEFHQATEGRARALNAVGVLAKIDLHPAILQRRAVLAATLANGLLDSLNTVVPVSAGLRRALDRLVEHDRAGLRSLTEALRSIPASTLEKLLDSEEFFLELEPADCPVSIADRERLLDAMPWSVFATIARLAADPTLSLRDCEERIKALAGFDTLNETLERHFFKRSQFLRSHRILNDVRQVLGLIKLKHLPEYRRREREGRLTYARFMGFIRAAGGDPAVARELEEFLGRHLILPLDMEAVIRDLDREFAQKFHELEEYNADFESLQQIEEVEGTTLFSPQELDELRPLLGLYGLETEKRLPAQGRTAEYVEERQQWWSRVSMLDKNLTRREVAQRAVTRYGMILYELVESQAAAPAG